MRGTDNQRQRQKQEQRKKSLVILELIMLKTNLKAT